MARYKSVLHETIRRVFFSGERLRAGWRAVLFLLLMVALAIAIGGPAKALLRHRKGLQWQLVGYVVAVLIVAIPTWIMARFVEHKPFTAFGLSARGRGPRLTAGLVCGFFSLALLLGILRLAGGFSFGGVVLHGPGIAAYALAYSAMFLLVALFEELLTRGYLLFVLVEGIGFWPAAVLLSALFAAGHLENAGENKLGILNALLIGIFLAWTVHWTGSLWWAIGYHAAWDWAESFFFGVPDSGVTMPGHLLTGTPSGPVWLSGGSAGPEGSALLVLIVAVLAIAVRAVFRSTPPPQFEQQKATI